MESELIKVEQNNIAISDSINEQTIYLVAKIEELRDMINSEFNLATNEQEKIMNTEKIGEIFIDGRIVNLDNSSVEDLDSMLEKIDSRKKNIMNNIDEILTEIQGQGETIMSEKQDIKPEDIESFVELNDQRNKRTY